MAIDDYIPQIVGYAPGFGAAFLSVYNWYNARRGSVIKPGSILNYGVFNFVLQEEHIFYFPILLVNNGTATGTVRKIKLVFEQENSDAKVIDITRRVKLKEVDRSPGQRLNREDFIEELPLFPIFVPSKQGKVVIFECHDYYEEVIPVNVPLTCRIIVMYESDRESYVSFPFLLLSEDIRNDNYINWVEKVGVKTHPSLLSSDRENLRSLLKEVELDEKYEFVVNDYKTQFDRSENILGTKIKTLSLSELKFEKLPSSITKFSHLHRLFLENNTLVSLPENFGSLPELSYLYLKRNALANLPNSIGNISNLVYLDLSENKLDSLPTSLVNLEKLEILNLKNNQLKKLPDSMVKLSNLERLNLEKNEFSELNGEITKMQKITHLNIASNAIEKLPENITALKNLKFLKISDCGLSSLPDNFGDLKNLEKLDIGNNKLITLPDSFFNITKLEQFSYNGNKFDEDTQKRIKSWTDELRKKKLRSINTGISE